MNPKPNFLLALRKRLGYTISLPERTLRSLAALAGGTSAMLTETLLPDSLRGTTTYAVTIGMLQRFVLERVAGIEAPGSSAQSALDEDYVRKKIAGTALEAAGLLVLSSSPLWVFAIAGDAAGGSRVFLDRLVLHLKENKVIPAQSEVKDLVGLLEAVQDASRRSATAIDQPPLSRTELEALARDLALSGRRAFQGTANLLAQLDLLWGRMERVVRRESIPLARLGGIMALEAAAVRKRGTGTLLAVGKTGAELIDEKILDSYRTTLAEVSKAGADRYLAEHFRPFLQSALEHFDSGRETWTERRIGRRKPPAPGEDEPTQH